MIEKMLPTSCLTDNSKDCKLLELWAHETAPQKNWVKMIETPDSGEISKGNIRTF
jgi:hypothetical protein